MRNDILVTRVEEKILNIDSGSTRSSCKCLRAVLQEVMKQKYPGAFCISLDLRQHRVGSCISPERHGEERALKKL